MGCVFLKKEHFAMTFLMSLDVIKSGIVLGHSSAQSSVYILPKDNIFLQ